MNASLRCSVVIALALTGTVALNPPGASASDGWYHDYDAAVAAARREGKPILADFSTGWCHNCRDLERKTLSDPSITARLDGFVKVHVDGDARPDMVRSFNVDGYPTLVALTPSGHELDRSVGYVNAGELAGTLDGVTNRMGSMRKKAATPVATNDPKSHSHDSDDSVPAKTDQVVADSNSKTAPTPNHDTVAKPSPKVDPIKPPADVAMKTQKNAKPIPDRTANAYLLTDDSKLPKPGNSIAMADARSDDAIARIKSSVQSKPSGSSHIDVVDNPAASLSHSQMKSSRAVAAADSGAHAGAAAPGGGDESSDLPHPMLNVGATRNSDALPAPTAAPAPAHVAPAHVTEEPATATQSEPTIKKPKSATAETKTATSAAAAVEAPAVKSTKTASDKSAGSDPLATIKKLQGKSGASGSKAAVKLPTETEGDSAAVKVPTSKQTAFAKPRETPAEAATDSAEATPAPDNGDDTAATHHGPVSADDINRWMKDGDQKLVAGHKKEAGAMYAKVVTNDPKNSFGRADMAYVKMCSLMVDRDDDELRKKAYDKIKGFDAKFPTSPNKDYYTVIRAMMAADLGETKSAHALLSDYPTRFPNSKYTQLAHDTLVGLGALPADKTEKPAKSSSDKSSKSGSSKSSSSGSSSKREVPSTRRTKFLGAREAPAPGKRNITANLK